MTTKAYCREGQHYPDQLISFPLINFRGQLEPIEIGILCENDGQPTNNWADGTAGVPPDLYQQALEDESPVCAEHLEVVEWQHT